MLEHGIRNGLYVLCNRYNTTIMIKIFITNYVYYYLAGPKSGGWENLKKKISGRTLIKDPRET